MRPTFLPLAATVLAVVAVFCLPARPAKNPDYAIAWFAKYVQIPGATSVGAEACTTCHTEIAKDFRHAFHAQQGVECERCHGPGMDCHDPHGGASGNNLRTANTNQLCLSCHSQYRGPYLNTASATLRPMPLWNLGLGYSYQQNNLTTYMAFQNDSASGYVFTQPAVPYKQIGQTY